MSLIKNSHYTAAALAATIRYCALVLVVCALLIGFTRARLHVAEHRNDLAAQLIRMARAHVDQANERRAVTEKYLVAYKRLIKEGSM